MAEGFSDTVLCCFFRFFPGVLSGRAYENSEQIALRNYFFALIAAWAAARRAIGTRNGLQET